MTSQTVSTNTVYFDNFVNNNCYTGESGTLPVKGKIEVSRSELKRSKLERDSYFVVNNRLCNQWGETIVTVTTDGSFTFTL